MCCSVLHLCYSELQCVAVCCSGNIAHLKYDAKVFSVLQYVVVCCTALQCVVVAT